MIARFSVLYLFVICSFFNFPSFSASITVAWDPNQEIDLAGYKVYWGTLPKTYSRSEYIGNETKYVITELDSGVHYYIAITALDFWGNESKLSNEVHGMVGTDVTDSYRLELFSNAPNPFNTTTLITYSVPSRTRIRIEILNSLGQSVRTLYAGISEAGIYTEIWDGTDNHGKVLTSGVYYCCLKIPNHTLIKPLTFLR